MPDLTIGRAGLDPALPTLEIETSVWDGDIWSLTGQIVRSASDTTPVDSWRAIRQQIRGLTEFDEAVVPVTWAQDPTLDGWYQVEAATVDSNPISLAEGAGPFTATLRRVGSSPLLDHRLRQCVAPNSHSLQAVTHIGDSFVGIPGTATELGFPGNYVEQNVSTASGLIYRAASPWFSSTQLVVSNDYRYVAPPAGAYQGSCRVTANYGGTYRPVVGRRLGSLSATQVVADNGLIRIEAQSSGFGFERWNGSAWQTLSTIFVGDTNNSNLFTNLRSVTILRNSPETVQIRLSYAGTSSIDYHRHIDIILQRGQPYVALQALVTSPPPAGYTWHLTPWRLTPNPAVACVGVSMGGVSSAVMQATTGPGLVLACPDAHTRDTNTGVMTYSTSVQSGRFMVGYWTSGVYPNRAYDVAGQMFSPIAQRLSATVR